MFSNEFEMIRSNEFIMVHAFLLYLFIEIRKFVFY